MRALSTERGKANTAMPVRKDASAVRFSASRTWISPKMTLSSFGKPFPYPFAFESNPFSANRDFLRLESWFPD